MGFNDNNLHAKYLFLEREFMVSRKNKYLVNSCSFNVGNGEKDDIETNVWHLFYSDIMKKYIVRFNKHVRTSDNQEKELTYFIEIYGRKDSHNFFVCGKSGFTGYSYADDDDYDNILQQSIEWELPQEVWDKTMRTTMGLNFRL